MSLEGWADFNSTWITWTRRKRRQLFLVINRVNPREKGIERRENGRKYNVEKCSGNLF